jgi:hypothetical protein
MCESRMRFAFGDRQPIFTRSMLEQPWVLAGGVLCRLVFEVAVAVPVEQELVRAQQEGAGPAGGVEDGQRANAFGFGRLVAGG